MLTLSQATADSRTFLKISIIIVSGILGIILLFRILIAVKEIIFPTPPPPPTVSFGVLPKIAFPQSATQKRITYSINTVSGTLPIFPDRAYVNKINGYVRSIFDIDDSNQRAAKIGFTQEGIKLSDTAYRWNEDSNLKKQLTMDIVSKDFIMTSLFTSDPLSISQTTLKDESEAKQAASSFISAMNEVPQDLNDSKTSAVLYRVDNGALLPASSLSNTQIIGVYFFQSDVNGLPITYPSAGLSTMNIMVGSGQFEPEVVAANFSHQNISDVSSTYPIKTSQEAYSELKAGSAYISTYYGGDKIDIQNVFLAYYLGEEKQSFLMPVIVFEGSNGFNAYVSAVKDEWIKN